ncbi:MAG TPA: cytochrome c [Gemmatimonadaceae bacterium]|nr:cytochrome c [Gemmatimonadaceae bacterium]
MLKKRWIVALPAVLLATGFARYAGGWAVVSVQDLPDYAVAGQPLTLTYTVRQHGDNYLSDLRGSVIARSRNAKIEVPAKAAPPGQPGTYSATLTLPNAGDWAVTIESGFRKSRVASIPMRALETGTKTLPSMAPDERGRRLFVAKGCVTCHTHSDSRADLGEFAPELTGKKFAPSYLAEFLANPSIKPPTVKDLRMPNLNLKQQEISALVAFINSDRKVAVAAR